MSVKGWRIIMSLDMAAGILGILFSIVTGHNYLTAHSPYNPTIAYLQIAARFIVLIMGLYGISKAKRIGYYAIWAYIFISILSYGLDPVSFVSVFSVILTIVWIGLLLLVGYLVYLDRKYFGIK